MKNDKEVSREELEKEIKKDHKNFKADMAKMSKMEFQEFREETIRQLSRTNVMTNELYKLIMENIEMCANGRDQLFDMAAEKFKEISERFKTVDGDLGSTEDNFKIIGKRMYATDLFLTCFAHGAMEFMGGRPLSMERKKGIASHLSIEWNEEVDGKLSEAMALTG